MNPGYIFNESSPSQYKAMNGEATDNRKVSNET